jgi:hypothetical protein
MVEEKEFSKEFECRGKWWLPDNPELKISGVLKFSPTNGGTLKLDGMLDPESEVYLTRMRDFPIILGLTTDNEEITLKDCFEISYELYGNTSISSIDFTSLFKKAHFEKEEDIKFKSIDTNYSYLDEWIGISGLSFKYGEEDKDGFSITYKPPDHFMISINDFKLSLIFKTEYSMELNEFYTHAKAYLRIEFNDGKEHSFKEFLDIFNKIKNFLSLCVWVKPVYYMGITGKTELNKRVFGDKITLQPAVEILFQERYFQKEIDIGSFSFLVRFEQIRERFAIILSNWFNKAELLEPFYNLYFGLLYNPHLYLGLQFLSLTQAIEFYHRKIYSGNYVCDEEYNAIYNDLLQAIPQKTNDGLKERLKTYLEFGNEFTLRKRLEDILMELDWLMAILFERKEEFINEVVKLRNYFTHYSSELSVDDRELLHIVEILNRIVAAIMLKEIGFDSEELKCLFNDNRLFRKIL